MRYRVGFQSGLELIVWGEFEFIQHDGRRRPSIKVYQSDVVFLIADRCVVKSETYVAYQPPPTPVPVPAPIETTKTELELF